MGGDTIGQFGQTARGLSRNPLGIIALFIVMVYGFACLVLITGNSLNESERLPIIYFLVSFPIAVLGVFTFLVFFRSGQLFAPGDFQSEANYLELQRMRYSAVASLAVAKHKDDVTSDFQLRDIAGVVSTVEGAFDLSRHGTRNPFVLWVDDNPDNNYYERNALEAVGIKFVLSESTENAMEILYSRQFGAVISDMGRREGPREGYRLLDELRKRGNKTPLFFYASSSAPEHRAETARHGGQGCTNDGQELFEMVTTAIFGTALTATLAR